MAKPYDATLKGMLERRQPWAPPGAEDLWTATYVLMGLRYPQPLIEQLLRGVIAMEESVTYQEIKKQGLFEGKLQEARANIRLLGRTSLGPPSDAENATLDSINDLERLHQLLLRISQVQSWQELFS